MAICPASPRTTPLQVRLQHLYADGCAGWGQPNCCDACRLHLGRPAGQHSVPRRLLAMCALPIETLWQCACQDEKMTCLLTALQQVITNPATRAAMRTGSLCYSRLQSSTCIVCLKSCRIHNRGLSRLASPAARSPCCPWGRLGHGSHRDPVLNPLEAFRTDCCSCWQCISFQIFPARTAAKVPGCVSVPAVSAERRCFRPDTFKKGAMAHSPTEQDQPRMQAYMYLIGSPAVCAHLQHRCCLSCPYVALCALVSQLLRIESLNIW